MRLSKRGEYGIRAMIEMASWVSDNAGRLIQIKDIAERQNIPPKFLEQILLSLKNAGMINSRMGIGGGYYLTRPSDEISIGQIVRILDGPLAPIRCVSHMAYEPCGCPDERSCGLRLVMLDVRNAIAEVLDQTSLAETVHRSQNASNNPLEFQL
jgi:Rrf2 family protein